MDKTCRTVTLLGTALLLSASGARAQLLDVRQTIYGMD